MDMTSISYAYVEDMPSPPPPRAYVIDRLWQERHSQAMRYDPQGSAAPSRPQGWELVGYGSRKGVEGGEKWSSRADKTFVCPNCRSCQFH